MILNIIFHLIILFNQTNITIQNTDSITYNENSIFVISTGIAYLGSGITESDAKIIAINDGKIKALEKVGTYLESHTTILNYQLVKDEIISFTGGLLKVDILNERRTIINDMFSIVVDIKVQIDINYLNNRINEFKKNNDYKRKLLAEKERNDILQRKIKELQNLKGTEKTKVQNIINSLAASDWYLKGFNAYEAQDYNKAIYYFSESIKLDSNYAEAYNARGSVYWFATDKFFSALEDFNKAIKINPNIARYYYNRGLTSYVIGNFHNAQFDYNIAIKLNSQDPEFYHVRGLLLKEMKIYNNSIHDFSSAIKLNPTNGRYYFHRGYCYLSINDIKNALSDFTISIDLDSKFPDAFYYRGSVYEKKGYLKKAIEDYKTYLEFTTIDEKRSHEIREKIIDLGFTKKK
jgi:tetratricopeptide (TPR) repeat protein